MRGLLSADASFCERCYDSAALHLQNKSRASGKALPASRFKNAKQPALASHNKTPLLESMVAAQEGGQSDQQDLSHRTHALPPHTWLPLLAFSGQHSGLVLTLGGHSIFKGATHCRQNRFMTVKWTPVL